MRPESEIYAFLSTQRKFTKANPELTYYTLDKVYENEENFVYRVMRRSDSKIFIMKTGLESPSDIER